MVLDIDTYFENVGSLAALSNEENVAIHEKGLEMAAVGTSATQGQLTSKRVTITEKSASSSRSCSIVFRTHSNRNSAWASHRK